MVWHDAHVFCTNTACPRRVRSLCGGAAGCCCSASQASNWAGGSTTTRTFIQACSSPQNCVQMPSDSPACSGRSWSLFVLPGMASIIRPNCGTQKLCSTSADSICACAGVPSGRCSSLAVTAPGPAGAAPPVLGAAVPA